MKLNRTMRQHVFSSADSRYLISIQLIAFQYVRTSA